jgi:hypothetical protein
MRSDENERILFWVFSIDAFTAHSEVRNKPGEHYYYDSGNWLFDDKLFEAWFKDQNGCLVLRGSYGTGKSSLLSIAIEKLRSDPATGRLAFYYCSQGLTEQSGEGVTQHRSSNRKGYHRSVPQNDLDSILLCLLRQASLLDDGQTIDTDIVTEFRKRR